MCRSLAVWPPSSSLSIADLSSAATPKPRRIQLENGATLSPAVAHRVEVLLRGKAQLPPGSTIAIGPVQPSDVAGFHTINVTFTADDKTSHPVNFLLSDDGKTIAQFIKYDISADPRTMVSDAGRPSRGGPASAPVVIVNFDDLECPFCARFHDSLFPAITQRYGDKVHIVYHDFPLDQHPWAMHAAVDVNCLAAQSPAGYWNLVDYIHHNAEDIGSDPNAKPDDHQARRAQAHPRPRLHPARQAHPRAGRRAEGRRRQARLLHRQAGHLGHRSLQAARHSLNIESTPTYFINGEKFEGALPIDYVFARIDDALRAETSPHPLPT